MENNFYISFIKNVNNNLKLTSKEIRNYYNHFVIHENMHKSIYDKFGVYNTISLGFDYNTEIFEGQCQSEYPLYYILPKYYPRWLFIESIQILYDLIFDFFCQFTFHRYFIFRIMEFFYNFEDIFDFYKKFRKIKKVISYKKKLCVHCDDLNNLNIGIWKIFILRKFKGKYSKRKIKWLCDSCLIEGIEGYRSGGGLQPYEIKKIRQRRFRSE